jgi:mRNA interferase RelE/StbE
MAYQVIIPKSAQKQIEKLSKTIRLRVLERVMALQDDPRPPGCLKLKGYENRYRIRIGDYRVTYQVFDEELIVILVRAAHRKDVYRD